MVRDNMDINKINEVIDSYSALRENFEIQKSFLELKSAYSDFVIEQPILKINDNKIPRIIWWCWLQGIEQAPDICKVSLSSIKKFYSDCEIIILDNHNINDFIELPLYIKEKYAQGKITHAHYTDIVRTFLLCKYGGAWIDSTVYCTEYDEVIFEENMFAYKHILRGVYGIPSSSWLLSACPKHPIMMLTRDLLCSYWRSNDNLYHYFMFHMFLLLAAEKYADIWNELPLYSNVPPQMLRYELGKIFSKKRFAQLKKMSSFHKLTYRLPDAVYKPKTFYNVIIQEKTSANDM